MPLSAIVDLTPPELRDDVDAAVDAAISILDDLGVDLDWPTVRRAALPMLGALRAKARGLIEASLPSWMAPEAPDVAQALSTAVHDAVFRMLKECVEKRGEGPPDPAEARARLAERVRLATSRPLLRGLPVPGGAQGRPHGAGAWVVREPPSLALDRAQYDTIGLSPAGQVAFSTDPE